MNVNGGPDENLNKEECGDAGEIIDCYGNLFRPELLSLEMGPRELIELLRSSKQPPPRLSICADPKVCGGL